MYLDRKHIVLLKKIAKNKIIRTDRHKVADIEYLRAEGLVIVTCMDQKDDFYYHPQITEKGKGVIYEWTRTTGRADIAIFMSAVALIISFLVAFTPFADWSKELVAYLMLKLFSQ